MLKMIPFILLMFAAIVGMNFYVFFRLLHLLPFETRFSMLIISILSILPLLLFVVAGFWGNALPTALASVLYRISTAWLIVAMYLMFAFLLFDLLRIFLPMKTILNHNGLTCSILFITMTAIFTYGYLHYKNKIRVELPITIMKPIKPLKIVAISDLHIGYAIGKSELETWVELINAEQPDLVLIAGDVVDNNVQPLIEQNMAAVFHKIRSRYGVFACVGNHESIGAGITHSLDFLYSAGITVLRDSSTLINNELYIVGRDDRNNHSRKSLDNLLQNLDHTKPIILLDHQPFNLEETEQNGVDLQISGHTHHGQIFPLSLITERMYEIAHGYLKKGNSHIYVSSGIGIWGGKFRIGTQSEYVVIELKN